MYWRAHFIIFNGRMEDEESSRKFPLMQNYSTEWVVCVYVYVYVYVYLQLCFSIRGNIFDQGVSKPYSLFYIYLIYPYGCHMQEP